MNELNELQKIIANIHLLPDWAEVVALNLLGIYIILQLIQLILKKFQTPEIRQAISTLKELSGEALRAAGRSLELPVERPKLALFALILNAILFYIFALIFFAWFGVFLMIGTTSEGIPLVKRLIGFGAAGAFFVAAR